TGCQGARGVPGVGPGEFPLAGYTPGGDQALPPLRSVAPACVEGVIVPPTDDTTGESFHGLVLRLRGRTGLTQRELAARVGVNVNSIQGWEAGATYPGVASLKALVLASVQAGGFSAGREREEVQALWAAALREAPRFRIPFDHAWFEQIVVGPREPVLDDTGL